MTTLIQNGTIVNEGEMYKADIIIVDDIISDIAEIQEKPRGRYDNIVDATGCLIMPGCIDTHVHFREPGLTHKADIDSESRAAAYGGVTSYFDMPNTKPLTTTPETLEEKFALAKEKSHVNYSFFFGATNDNAHLVREIDRTRIPGIKLFMGSSTGNMLVDREQALDSIFSAAARMDLIVMAHCEDTDIINRNMRTMQQMYGDDPDVSLHPKIRSAEACIASSSKAVEMALRHKARLHIAHLTTKDEIMLLDKTGITGEVTVSHLLFSDEDYATAGTLIKCNPAIKTTADRQALRCAAAEGILATVATDHAAHTVKEKEGAARKAMSGMPMIQFSLPAMMSLVDENVFDPQTVVRLMSHNPATLFGISGRGFLRKGYKADIAILTDRMPYTVDKAMIQSKCGWSPVEGRHFNWKVIHTFCNGQHILDNGKFDEMSRGEAIVFNTCPPQRSGSIEP